MTHHYTDETMICSVYSYSTCDNCGADNREVGILVPVAIEVNLNEEFGCRDEYDYCDDCFIAKAPALHAAGSRSSLVATPNSDGTLPTYYCPGCDERHEPPLHAHPGTGGYDETSRLLLQRSHAHALWPQRTML